MRTDGGRGSFLNLPSTNNKDSIIENIDFLNGGFSPIQMNGQEVYKFAVREVPIILEKLFRKTNYSSDEVDWLVLHQANQRILDSVGDRLKIPREKILSNLEKYGNTSAATIPLMMDEAIRNNRIKQNDIIATSGFGAGLSWGAALIKWG
jgi:3-oxoacyl-[acyl-carrier-protein] synthase III